MRVRHVALRCLSEMIQTFSDPTSVEGLDGMYVDPTKALSLKMISSTASTGHAARAKAKEALRSIQDSSGDIILPALIESMGELNADVPRSRTAAAIGIVDLCHVDYCPAALVKANHVALLGGLFNLLNEIHTKSVSAFVCASGPHVRMHRAVLPLPQAQEAGLIAVGTIAQVLDEDFTPFYSTFVEIAKRVLELATGDEYALVRCQALQAISMITQAVGKEVAGADAAVMLTDIMRSLANREVINPDIFDFTLMAAGRIASTLGADFAPYMSFFVPALTTEAMIKVRNRVCSCADVRGFAA